MKSSSKIIMLAAATAVVSSAITAYAMKQVLFPAEEAQSFNELFAGSAQAQGQVTRVSQLPANTSDFTKAAESTINGVVSIKSYATPRGYSRQQQGGGFSMIRFSNISSALRAGAVAANLSRSSLNSSPSDLDLV